MADARLMVGIVRAPERTKFAEEVRAFVRHFGRTQPIDGITARLLPDGVELIADLVDRDIPGNPGPLTVRQLHRIFEPALAGHELAHRGAFGAVGTAVDRRIPARLLSDPDAVGNFGSHGASDRTVRADALA